MDGLKYFLWASTCGKSSKIPYLDEHIRSNIWRLAYPISWLTCYMCHEDVLLIDANSNFIQTNKRYYVKNEKIICFKCDDCTSIFAISEIATQKKLSKWFTSGAGLVVLFCIFASKFLCLKCFGFVDEKMLFDDAYLYPNTLHRSLVPAPQISGLTSNCR